MINKKTLRIILIFCIALFLAWISFFDQTLQLRFKDATLIFLCIFFVLSFLYKKQIKFSKIDLALFIYLSIVSLTLFSSENKSVALEWYRIYIIPIPLVYFAVRNLDKNFIPLIIKGIFAFSTSIAIFGILEIIFHKNIIYEFWVENPYYHRFISPEPTRIMSTLMHPTIFGSFLLGCLPFSFYLASKVRSPYKVFIKFSILICIIGIIFSFSRGNIAGLIGSSVIYLFLTKRVRYIKFIFIGLLALIIFSSTFLRREFNFIRFSVSGLTAPWWRSESERSHITLKILKERPLLGIGLNHYRLKFDRYSSPEYKEREERLERLGYDTYESKIPDNMYLCILAETGLLGFLGFMLFLFLLFKKGLTRLKTIKDTAKKELLIACLCGIIGLMISMNTYDLLYWANPFLLFWFLAGLLLSLTIKSPEKLSYPEG